MRRLPLLLLLTPFVAGCAAGPSKSDLDDEVRRLCAIDGGVKVYETAPLTPNLLDRAGRVRILSKQKAVPGDEYYYESGTTYLKHGNPEMWRDNFKIYRKADSKLLGESVRYVRRGGDLPSPMHESSFSCPPNRCKALPRSIGFR